MTVASAEQVRIATPSCPRSQIQSGVATQGFCVTGTVSAQAMRTTSLLRLTPPPVVLQAASPLRCRRWSPQPARVASPCRASSAEPRSRVKLGSQTNSPLSSHRSLSTHGVGIGRVVGDLGTTRNFADVRSAQVPRVVFPQRSLSAHRLGTGSAACDLGAGGNLIGTGELIRAISAIRQAASGGFPLVSHRTPSL